MVVCGIDSFEKNLLPSVNKLAKSLYNSVWRTLASGELSEVHTGISTVPKLCLMLLAGVQVQFCITNLI